jgi:hypothetical protein
VKIIFEHSITVPSRYPKAPANQLSVTRFDGDQALIRFVSPGMSTQIHVCTGTLREFARAALAAADAQDAETAQQAAA